MADRPLTLSVTDLEQALVESVELAIEERTSAPHDPVNAFAPLEPAALSGYLPCE